MRGAIGDHQSSDTAPEAGDAHARAVVVTAITVATAQ